MKKTFKTAKEIINYLIDWDSKRLSEKLKLVFSEKEGVKMNSKLDFGSTSEIEEEFNYFLDTLEIMQDIDFRYYYRITDDNYIQLALKFLNDELEICAQYELKYDNLKKNIIHILEQNIEANSPYTGYPKFVNSTIFTEKEFNTLIKSIQNRKLAIINEAKSKSTNLINFLKFQGLNPKPTGNNPNSWVSKCPSGGNHNIMISTINDEWGCGYCNRKGNKIDLEAWILRINLENK